MSLVIIGEESDPWLIFAIGHLDNESMTKQISESGYVADKKLKYSHEFWRKDPELGWVKSSGHNNEAVAVTTARW